MPCRECGAAQLLCDDAGSLVCTNCGTLVDPAQRVLADSHGSQCTVSYSAPCTSKKGWHLAQTKQDRDRKNMIAMNTFIGSVLSRLNNPGLSPRAEALFSQAISKGNYRWGRKAKLTAGASIAIALREARKSDSLRDIAFLLDDSTVSLARAFQSVVSLLDFSLPFADPAVHLPTLHAHLHSIIHLGPTSPSPPSQLPKSLVSILRTLSLQTAIRTATSLSQIIFHHSPPLSLTKLPTPPTACALLILGLEAEARAPLPHLAELTRTLGIRFALASGVVSSRYKVIYNLIAEWIRHVPWLDQFIYKGKGRGPTARSKIPKRAIVAKGIRDVIQFHEEIWLSRSQNLQRVKLNLELDPGDLVNGQEGDDEEMTAPTTESSSPRGVDEFVFAPPPEKRRKVVKKASAMQATCEFLLDPVLSRYSDAASSTSESSLLTHALTCSLDQLSQARETPPTRLQLLAASRGGRVEDIADEELFAVGELEGLLRNEEEQEALRPLFQLNWGEDESRDEPAVRKPPVAEAKRGAKRVNMDVLARVLCGNVNDDGSDEGAGGSLDPNNDVYSRNWDDAHHPEYQTATEDAELVSDWRPASPDVGSFGALRDTVGDRYQEEL